jgi:hypothetical protein
MSEASPQDYVRDPTRWGSPEVAALFPGFKHLDMRRRAPSFACVMELRAAFALASCLSQQSYALGMRSLQNWRSSLPDPGAGLINAIA